MCFMKKVFLFILSVIIITTIFVAILYYFFQVRNQKGALQVTSAPESKVYLNDQYIGDTPLCKCESEQMIKTGDYLIRLVPQDKNLSEFQEKITITSGVLTVVDRKFEKNAFSEGSIISLTPLADKLSTALQVVSLPEGSLVLLDNEEIGTTPVSFPNPTESDHILKIKKSGYKEKTIRIRTPLGYKLTVTAYLGVLEDLSIDTSPATDSASFSTTPTPTQSGPTPSGTKQKMVKILTTPTGFLRVRSAIGGVEIGQVNPGETYSLLDEKSGWFSISFKNKVGWISNQYAEKVNTSQ